jgi:hypothetical protein
MLRNDIPGSIGTGYRRGFDGQKQAHCQEEEAE